MKNKLTKNIGLKIVSLFFAALMWIIVTNINDPVDTRSFDNVPVRIINANLLEESDRVYQVLEDTDIIKSVTVKAPRSVISRISYANIIAQANINDLSSLDTVAITVDVSNASPSEISDIIVSSNILKLDIENRKSRNIQIRSNIEGEISEGYMRDDFTYNPSVVSISGPESLIDSVAYADFSYDITNINTDIKTNADIILHDREGKRILSDRINQNDKTVSLTIPILETKIIPIRYNVVGIPASGYLKNGNEEISRNEVLIAGKGPLFRETNEIIIANGFLDISDSTETFMKEFNLTDFLPNNIRLADSSEKKVTVKIGIEEEANRIITLRESQLRLLNVPQGFKAGLDDFDETPPITLIGLQQDLNLVQPTVVTGEIDILKWMSNRNINQLTEGNYQMPVDINLGNDISVSSTVSVTVSISIVEAE